MYRVVFTDPEGEFEHGDEPLFQALKTLIGKAKTTIDIHGFSLGALRSKEEIFTEALTGSLERGASLRVFGHDYRDLNYIKGNMVRFSPRCYHWKRDSGLYHIKAISVDSRYVYMGSANISDAAMRDHAEWGTIIESNHMADELSRFADYLIESGMMGIV